MPVELPIKVIPKTLFSPRIILFYGMPKIGKTKISVDLPGNLILEGDPEGCSMYECMWLPLWQWTYDDWKEFLKKIMDAGAENAKAGKTGVDLYPYKYITVDNVAAIQEIAISVLTKEYISEQKKKPADKRGDTAKEALSDPNFRINDLPHGSGHYLIRERVKQMINDLSSVCHKLILVAHVRDKELSEMANIVVYVKEIALMGKLGEIVAALVDAIGYVYRDGKGVLKVNFTSNERSTMGSRYRYLAGKNMEFSWEVIFPDEFGLPIPE